ncbi:hypothetical protein D7Z26_08805 [Cohnella endophytica]|uniref:Flagellar protein n=1 Tax=Cohnella endophytica TaxID=2419778 RepID=A0A494XZV0_9BACL|nr:hypothetical protein [Cohnella endophytica]RKP55298.1 hypothetical protein D7Z26_08805 [Cohnella endophytica]
MSYELLVAHCPECGNVFQKNVRNLCTNCSILVDDQMSAIEKYLLRDRMATTQQLAAGVSLSVQKVRSWIRKGKLKIYDYPNLTDQCDLCSSEIRKGHLCPSCASRINEDIARTFERERIMKERLRAENNYRYKK